MWKRKFIENIKIQLKKGYKVNLILYKVWTSYYYLLSQVYNFGNLKK